MDARVLDQGSELAVTLRSLIDQAETMAEQASKRSAFLQDRLQVGVRLLGAFQTQIEHVQTLLQTMETCRASAVGAVADLAEMRSVVEGRLRQTLDSLQGRADDLLGSVFERYERQITAREEALARLDEELARAQDRAEALTRMVESAEVNVAVLAHKSAQAAREAAERADEARRKVGQLVEAKPRKTTTKKKARRKAV